MKQKRGLELLLTGCANAEKRQERIERLKRNRGKRRKGRMKLARDKLPKKKGDDGKAQYPGNTLFTAVGAVA